MSDALPAGWTPARIEQVVEDFQPGFASGEKNVEGGVAHLRMNNIGLDGELVLDLLRTVPEKLAKSRHNLRRGDVLVCTTNSGKLVGKCAFFDLPGRYVFSNHLTRLRPNDTFVDGRYLRWGLWLQWKSGAFDDQCKHWVNQSSLPKDALLESEIPLPPLPEQRRIVAKLETLLGKVDACQRRLAKIPRLLKRFRQSVLAAACSGRFTTDWRKQNPDVESAEKLITKPAYKIAEPEEGLAELPEKWVWAALGNYARCSRGRFSVRPRNDPSCFDGEHPFIQIGSLNSDGGWVRAHTQTLNAKGLSVSKKFPKGTVVIAIVGATIGNTGLLAYDMCFPDSLVGLETGTTEGNRFIEYFLRDRKHDIRQASYSSGGQPNIKLEFLNPYPLALPPLAEQCEIVRRVEQFFTFADQLEARFAKAQAHVDKLTQSLLAKAFRGELVPQDPNDEPASELLKRVRVDKDRKIQPN